MQSVPLTRPRVRGSLFDMTQAAPGWYPAGGEERFWDGSQWTDQTRPAQAPAAPQQPAATRDPNIIWQSVGKPVTGIGAGKYKLTHHYLFFEKGTLRTDSQQVPIAGVLDVDVIQSMTQKARGVGSIRVHIQRPHGIEIVMLDDIPDFRDGQRLINDTAHAARMAIQRNAQTHRYEGVAPMAAAAQPTAQTAAAPVAADPIEQLRKLGELRDAGILSDEEFTAKKADILSRM